MVLCVAYRLSTIRCIVQSRSHVRLDIGAGTLQLLLMTMTLLAAGLAPYHFAGVHVQNAANNVVRAVPHVVLNP